MQTLLGKLNGILWPGGEVTLWNGTGELTKFAQMGDFIYKWVLANNLEGNWIPLQGTCLGFKMLSLVASGDFNVISSPYADNDWTTNIKFWDSTSSQSELYKNMTQ